MAYKIGQNAAKSVLRNPAFIEQFTLIKQSAGDRDDDGIYQPGEDNIFPNERGSIQPLTGKERSELKEGERLLDAICILFETTDLDAISPLRIGTVQTESDLIVYNNLQWAVRVVHNMSTYGHLEVFATRLENQNG
ncbi:hypothetical protein KAR91_36180 [Candidatus Pacearchaeota archaeon]|nr:hypothetical protein [Candidatus Pacearchaeota archaeon]